MTRIRSFGHEVARFECRPESAEPVARALKAGFRVIVACGGDGTVSGVAAAVYRTEATLGVFPLGTLNHFARDLGIRNPVVAEQVLLSGRIRHIDAASLNGRLFINNSGIGIYPAMVREREVVRRLGIPKWPAFVIACLKALAHLPFLRLHLEIDGRRLSRVTPFLFVGNNVYQTEGFSLGRRPRLDAGKLVIFTARHSGPTGLIRIAFRALMGSIRRERDFTELTAEQLTVRTKRPVRMHVSLDGELSRMTTPLKYSILPAALRVLVP